MNLSALMQSVTITDGALNKGDQLVSIAIDGNTTEIIREYQPDEMMLDMHVGDVVTFNIIRDGQEMQFSLTITEACLSAY